MKRKHLIITTSLAIVLLSGCQINESNPEAEALQRARIELLQQVSELHRINSTQPENASYTMEDLTAMVNDFVERSAQTASNSANADLEEFFSFKQEINQIEHYLDNHEEELERQYREGHLSCDGYKTLERELKRLEDQLDNAEDCLERTFGIDDR